MKDFAIGDYVEIICHDGVRFVGVLMDFDADLAFINGCGFPHADISVMAHA